MKVLVIGAGNMGLTYAEGMAKSPYLNRRNLMIFDVSSEKTEALSAIPHFDAYDTLEDCLPKADVVFIAVKPYHSEDLFKTMKNQVNKDQVFVSLMAGITIESMQEGLGVKKV
ncbi:NAD(P)-binding domain-containing protein, partial [uncultured Marixanthomonas sp.]|uniref:pyrroline-5-carboxylate reductase family protein n=1 Tax=uncultured Marixanthomonas sp. TaxID=757245 RepID=UPI0030DAE63C